MTDFAQREQDLLGRCRLVQTHGWAEFQWMWSTGESAAVAYLLDDRTVLGELGENEDSVLLRWAGTLYGIPASDRAADDAVARTRRWFITLRSKLIAS